MSARLRSLKGQILIGFSIMAAIAAFALAATPTARAATPSFGKSLLAGESSTRPTVIQFGPDGRLYVLQQDGTLYIYRVVRDAANDYRVTATETVTLIKNIPNHDDNGTVNNTLGERQATGMVVTGTATRPVLYISSSDPRYGGGPRGDLNLDTNSGMVSRLSWTGTAWQKLDLVRGLPRSEENHSVNGVALNSSETVLYLAVGGHTNMGAPSRVFAELPEYAYSAAILAIDLVAIGNTTYDLPTLDDPARAGTNDANDPFGGNDAANQARIVAGSPVQIYATGFRNPYDVIISSKGIMYSADNGHNAGQGNVPVNEGPAGTCTNAINEPGVTGPDSIHVVTQGYYGGHANPTRGNKANTFHGESPILAAHAIECDYARTGAGAVPVLATDPSSSNGLAEYTASNFDGELKGDLLVAGYDNYVMRIDLDSTGQQNLGLTQLFSAVGEHPLDLVARGDGDSFPGTIWVVDVGTQNIYVFEPTDYDGGGTTCVGADNNTDEDGDGFTNSDEIDNATDPCSAGDRPHDWDNDQLSDLNDGDDDNDGRPDTSDPFAIDAANGLGRSIPLSYTFDDGTVNAGGLLGLGFTGLMTNGAANYESLFDPQQLTAGGAPGILTVDQLSPGDTTDNQLSYGFQFGVRPSSSPFMAHTTVVSPFAGTTPTGNQSIGLALGTGTQDDYVKVVLTANNGNPGVMSVREVGGVVTNSAVTPLTLPGPEAVELYLEVTPSTNTVQPAIRVVTGGVPGSRQPIGPALTVPASWLGGSAAVAVGVVGHSPAGATLSGNWDLLEVVAMGASAAARPDATIKRSGDANFLGENVYNTTALNQTRTVATAAGTTRTFVIRLGNDSPTADSFLVRGVGSVTGMTVRYLAGTSGSTDITSAVLAGTYRLNNVGPGTTRAIRAVVSVTTAAPSGTTRDFLVTASSVRSPSTQDVVDARVRRS